MKFELTVKYGPGCAIVRITIGAERIAHVVFTLVAERVDEVVEVSPGVIREEVRTYHNRRFTEKLFMVPWNCRARQHN